MSELTQQSLQELTNVQIPNYQRSDVRAGILHIGVGNFHRGHQAVYADDLLSKDPNWGIIGVSMRSDTARRQLIPQDCLYSVCTKRSGEMSTRVIGSILDVLTLSESRAQIIELGASESINCITLTVTENGYCHTAAGDIDWQHPDIKHDIAQPECARSAPGLLVTMLEARMAANTGPINLISCDNLSENGRILRKVVLALAKSRDEALCDWIKGNVAFPNTMVDRIVPSSNQNDIVAFSQSHFEDKAVITTEDFSQWVIEDCLIGNAPPWSEVGVQLASDVKAFETMKLRFLNATHSAISYLGLLCGFEFVHEALADPVLKKFATRLMAEEVQPVTDTPETEDIKAYQQSVLTRFSNSSVPYRTAQVATSGSLKLPQRILPSIATHRLNGDLPERLCTAVAAWLACITNEQITAQFTDPILPVNDLKTCHHRTDLLGALAVDEVFTNEIDRKFDAIKSLGIRAILGE